MQAREEIFERNAEICRYFEKKLKPWMNPSLLILEIKRSSAGSCTSLFCQNEII